MDELWRIIRSLAEAAQTVGVPVVTGDTKVVERGKGDGIFINTTGIGLIPPGVDIAPRRAQPGDLVLINGPIAEHGIAIMSVREGLAFETALESDSAPLHDLVAALLAAAGEQVHVLRDPTRGGVSSSLNEIAVQARAGIRLDEAQDPHRRTGARRVRDPGAGPALRGERGQVPGDRGARKPARRPWQRCEGTRSAAGRRSSARSWRTIPARSCSAAGSAAAASSTCSAGSSCRVFAKESIARGRHLRRSNLIHVEGSLRLSPSQ